VVNKWDLIVSGSVSLADYRDGVLERLGFVHVPPVVLVSALTGKSMKRIMTTAFSLYDRAKEPLTTGKLNSLIHQLQGRIPAPRRGGAPFRCYYAVQTGTFPLQITLFVNSPAKLTHTYRQFLENRLREHFQLQGIPIELRLRGKKAMGRLKGTGMGRRGDAETAGRGPADYGLQTTTQSAIANRKSQIKETRSCENRQCDRRKRIE